jgi:hypothetical protein
MCVERPHANAVGTPNELVARERDRADRCNTTDPSRRADPPRARRRMYDRRLPGQQERRSKCGGHPPGG